MWQLQIKSVPGQDTVPAALRSSTKGTVECKNCDWFVAAVIGIIRVGI